MSQHQTAIGSTLALAGGQVTIRPLAEGDRDAMLAFGQALPEEDRCYLEDDFHSPEIINRLVNAHAAENWRQIVAVHNDAIIAYGAARRLPGWSSHVAEIVLIVKAEWRRSGVGTAMASVIFEAARSLGGAKVIVELLSEQTAGRAIFERLGFRVEGTLSAHAHDHRGDRHDLMIMAYHV
ncbi:MAG TPA: GNAT family N-acetyltransferase [Roseiflexaceae bacterium]|nr:GNAT family N-acetyltransferase [Roseiflexaceae bacterium]